MGYLFKKMVLTSNYNFKTNKTMKKFLAIALIAATFAACNDGEKTETKVEAIDSTADARIEAVEEKADSTIDKIDSTRDVKIDSVKAVN